MAQLIKIKSGSAAPASASLLTGEPAYSINDNRLYIGNGSSVVRVDAGSYTAECSTAKDIAAKTVNCTGFILFKGVEITIKFTVDNTAAVSALTLNVGSTLAKPIRYRGTYLLSPSTLSKNRVYKFYYDGNNWELIGDLDTDTTVGAALTDHINKVNNPHSVTAAQVGLGNVENTALSTWAGSTAITTLGTIDTGTWNATTIAVGKGGTGKTSIASGKMLYASAANTYAEVTTSSFGRGLLNTSSGTVVSGLNADTVDGYHSSGLWRTDNAGSTSYDWSAKNLTLAGSITGAITGAFSSSVTANNFVASATSGFMFTAAKATKYNGFSAPVGGGFIFLTNGEALTGSAALTILANRYVGINNAEPSYNLDVTGTGYFSSNVIVGGTIQATTAKLTNLTDGYIPYHVSDASGLANSPIYTDGTNVGIGTIDPLGYKLYVSGTGHYTSNLSVGGTLGVIGATTLSTASVTNKLNFGSSGKWINLNGSASLYDVTAFNLSLKHPTPFIDFYFNGAGSATSRIIEQDTGVLDVIGSVKIPSTKYLQIGDAKFTFEEVGGVGFLKLAHSNGSTPMHLVTTGGQTMCSTGVPATGGGGGSGTLVFLNGSSIASETAYIYSPTSIGYPGYILKAADPSGLPVWDNISNLLPWGGSGSSTMVSRSDHSHNSYVPTSRTVNSRELSSNITLSYADVGAAAASHSHSGYALTSHNHYSIGDEYTALLLTGTTVTIHTDLSPSVGFWKSDNNGKLSVDTNTYALSSHNHTGVYAPITHSHNYLSSDAANTSDLVFAQTNGLGITFWNNAANFKITMTHISDTVYGGRIAGENSSDWNMYFHLYSGEGMMYNRGFVFQSNKTDKLMAINPSGIISNVGMTFNSGTIKGAVIDNYGVCSTAVSTGAKTVTISGFRLATGVQINVKFSNNNYAYPMTLNVSGTGAKTVKAYGDNDEQYFLEQIQAGAVVPFVYDGTYWVIPTTPSMY